jgi:4-hydroxybenzoate polyprenyltransferase
MMRPVNFPIVALFHALGVHLSVELWKSTAPNASTQSLLLPLLKHPSMLVVLLSLLLVTSTSMITNDYYDARNGVDVSSSEQRDAVHYHPLAQGLLSYSITKTFDSCLYAVLLLSSAFVPGVLPRLMVISGAIITYLYTVHLKPKTWIKNWSCAALVAISPVTSGLAAWHVLCGGGVGAVAHACAASSAVPPFRLVLRSPLAFLVVALFAGITSREILMDITDCESDARAGIVTVPVKYGRDVAAKVALGWSFLSCVASCALPLAWGLPLVKAGLDGHPTVALNAAISRKFMSMPLTYLNSVLAIIMTPGIRRLGLSLVGSTLLLYRAYGVAKTKGEDTDLAERAIGSSLFSVLLVLASFV